MKGNRIYRWACLLAILLGMALLNACRKEEALRDESVLGAGRIAQGMTELDSWIQLEITEPYGIEVQYRWEKKYAAGGSYTYPPDESKVKSVLKTIKALWLDLYSDREIGGEDYWKGRALLKLFLYGGQSLDAQGGVLIGNPESVAREMYLHAVNDFDEKNPIDVAVLMRSVHHQYARIIAEMYPYDSQIFSAISQHDYVNSLKDYRGVESQPYGAMFLIGYYAEQKKSAGCKPVNRSIYASEELCEHAQTALGIDRKCYYINPTMRSANQKGFYTKHSMLSPESDFAEIVSVYLTSSQQQIQEALRMSRYVNPGATAEEQEQQRKNGIIAHRHLVQKARFVEEYFSKEVGISLLRLQMISLQKMNAYLH